MIDEERIGHAQGQVSEIRQLDRKVQHVGGGRNAKSVTEM